MYRLTCALGIKPALVCGHSAGEWVAMVAGGILDADAIPRLHGKLGKHVELIEGIPRVALFALGISATDTSSLGKESGCSLEIVNDNCPHQVVVAVLPEDESAFAAHCRERRIFAEKLPFDRPFHSSHFDVLAEPLATALGTFGVSAPRVPTYSCSVASTFPDGAQGIVELAATGPARPVLFRRTVERMYAAGTRVFVEVGPGGVLSGFVGDTLAGRSHHAVSLDRSRSNGVAGLLHALAKLAALGVPMDLKLLYDVRGLPELELEEVLDRHRASGAGIDVPLAPAKLAVPACRIESRQRSASRASADLNLGDRDRFGDLSQSPMGAYFDTMETFISSQEDVMAAYMKSAESKER